MLKQYLSLGFNWSNV